MPNIVGTWRAIVATVNRPNAPQNYRTPPELLAAVERRFGKIEFDAACTREDCVALRGYHYPEADALTQDWSADLPDRPLVWTNPPFRLSGAFAKKHAEYEGRSLLLVPASVGSRWFLEHVHGRALVLPLVGRVTFVGEATPINRDLMICAYGWYFGDELCIGFEPWDWRKDVP
jgi:phage N-6-adenine-methyltransferase